MNGPALLHTIVGKRPWKVWKGVGSFLLFEFGRREVDPGGNTHGSFCLWIYMARWRIKKGRKEIAHSESPDAQIAKAASKLRGKRLNAVVLSSVITKGEVHYAARLFFEGDFIVGAYMYDRHEPSSIFMLHMPDRVLSYDYDGSLTVKKKIKGERIKGVRRAQGGARR
jgi:hypothetical protein